MTDPTRDNVTENEQIHPQAPSDHGNPQPAEAPATDDASQPAEATPDAQDAQETQPPADSGAREDEPPQAQSKTWYPYVTKTQFEKFLSRLENQVPDQIDRDYVRAIIRTPSMIYRFLRGIEAMRLIDREQAPTERLYRLVDTDYRPYAIAEILRDLYGDLVKQWQDSGETLSDDHMVDFFRERTGMGRDSANKMKMFFKYLLNEADFGEAPVFVAKPRPPQAPVDQPPPPAPEAVSSDTPSSPAPERRSQDTEAAADASSDEPAAAPSDSPPQDTAVQPPPQDKTAEPVREQPPEPQRNNQQQRREAPPQRPQGREGREGQGRDGNHDRSRGRDGKDSRNGGREVTGSRDTAGGREANAGRDQRSPQPQRDAGQRDAGQRPEPAPAPDEQPEAQTLNEVQRAYLQTLQSIVRVNVDGDWDEDMIKTVFERLERLFDRIRRN